MLSWPAGPRDTDGVWGPYWYESVWRSTGFGPYHAPRQALPAGLADLAERCRPYYERLHAAAPPGLSAPGARRQRQEQAAQETKEEPCSRPSTSAISTSS